MATVTVFTAERMQEIEDESYVNAEIIDGHLVLTQRNGVLVDAGPVGAASLPSVFPGTGLDRAENALQVNLTTANTRYEVCSITFDVPTDRDVLVTAKAPMCGGALGAITSIELTDGANVEKDTDSYRSPTANYYGGLSVSEIIPAGSGTVTRKLRAFSNQNNGFVNLLNSGLSYIDATVR